MGAYLSEPVRTKATEDECVDNIEYGASSMQGWRMEQEDTHNCLLKFDKDTSLFAVYDGHGGADVAQYTAERLPDFLYSSPLYQEGKLEEALKGAFLGFDATLVHEDVQEKLKKLAEVNTDDEEDQEQEVGNLFEEAHMPLDQLLQRYKQGGGRKEKFQSPMIRAKKDDAAAGDQVSGTDGEDAKDKLDGQLVNGHNGPGSAGDDKTSSSQTKSDNLPDSSVGTNGVQKNGMGTVIESKVLGPEEPTSVNVVQSSDVKVESSTAKPDSVQPAGSGSAAKSEAVTCSSDSGVSVSTSSDHLEQDCSGSSSAVTSSGCGGSSECSGSAGATSTDNQTLEASSSSGRTRRKRTGVVLDADDESFDEDEEDTEDEEDSDEDKDAWESDSEDDSDDEDDDEGPFGEDGEGEDEGAMMPKFSGEEPGYDSGCTAVLALKRGNQLYVANAGDSRCVLCRGGTAIDMSEDHKPEDQPERSRIIKAGGKITPNGRVNGGLNLSRAIGDHIYKQSSNLPAEEQMITALPDVRAMTLEEEDEFMVLACDGIWNTMTSQDVVTFVRERIHCGVRPLSAICAEMFDLILAPDTNGDGTGCDNMTCIIINFKAGPSDSIQIKVPSKAELSTEVKGSSEVEGSSDVKSSSEAEPSIKVDKMEESSEAEAAGCGNSSPTSSTKRKAQVDLEADSSSKKTKVDNADSSG